MSVVPYTAWRASWLLLFFFTFHTICYRSVLLPRFNQQVWAFTGLCWASVEIIEKHFANLLMFFFHLRSPFCWKTCAFFYITKVSLNLVSFSCYFSQWEILILQRHILVWLMCSFSSHTCSANGAVGFITWLKLLLYCICFGTAGVQISSRKKCDACSMEDSVDLCKMTRSEILCAKAAKILTPRFWVAGEISLYMCPFIGKASAVLCKTVSKQCKQGQTFQGETS